FNAIKSLEEAVALDPNFALAWARQSWIKSGLYFGYGQPQVRDGAQKALENAMRLQPNLPEVQLAQAFYQAVVLHDYEGARPIFERLLTELPNNADVPFWLPRISLVEGTWDEPRGYLNKAIELNPREIGLRLDAAWVREAVRDFPGALRCYDDALAVWP